MKIIDKETLNIRYRSSIREMDDFEIYFRGMELSSKGNNITVTGDLLHKNPKQYEMVTGVISEVPELSSVIESEYANDSIEVWMKIKKSIDIFRVCL